MDPSTDSRYTFINGRLVIDSPSSERADDGRYQCAATNIYGTILSNQVELAFGCEWNSFSLNEKLDRDSSFTLEESKRSEETSLVGRCLGNIIGDSETNLLQISQEINVTYEIIF